MVKLHRSPMNWSPKITSYSISISIEIVPVSDVVGYVGLTFCKFFVWFLLSAKYSMFLFHDYLNCRFDDSRSSEETIVHKLFAENNTATQR